MAQEGGEPPVVCIDPGHPSEVNSGMTVQNGTTETHIDWVVAQQLQKLGIQRVRPLQGGFRAWKELGYPLAEPAVVAWHTAVRA